MTRLLILLNDPVLRHAFEEVAPTSQVWKLSSGGAEGIVAPEEGESLLVLTDPATLAILPEADRERLERLGAQESGTCRVLLAFADGATPAWIAESFPAPVRLGHVLLRLQAHARALEEISAKPRRLGPWIFDPRGRHLDPCGGGDVVALTEKESSLLAYLLRLGSPASRDEILLEVWGYAPDLDTHTLETHVHRLRRKLLPGDNMAGHPDPVLVDSSGYRLHPEWLKP